MTTMTNRERLKYMGNEILASVNDECFFIEADGNYWVLWFYENSEGQDVVDEFEVEDTGEVDFPENFDLETFYEDIDIAAPSHSCLENEYFLHYPGEYGDWPSYRDLADFILFYGENVDDSRSGRIKRLRFVGWFFYEKNPDPDADSAEQSPERECPGYEKGDEWDLIEQWDTEKED